MNFSTSCLKKGTRCMLMHHYEFKLMFRGVATWGTSGGLVSLHEMKNHYFLNVSAIQPHLLLSVCWLFGPPNFHFMTSPLLMLDHEQVWIGSWAKSQGTTSTYWTVSNKLRGNKYHVSNKPKVIKSQDSCWTTSKPKRIVICQVQGKAIGEWSVLFNQDYMGKFDIFPMLR